MPKSRIVTKSDFPNCCGPILVEAISTVLVCLGSHRSIEVFLGAKGEIFAEFNEWMIAPSLTIHENSLLLKVLVLGTCTP